MPGHARAAPCGLPDSTPLHVEFADGSVQFRAQVFRRPGLVLAANGVPESRFLRAGGAQTIYWVMRLEVLVGTPDAPADPAGVPAAADATFDRAAAASSCATPLVALNELRGPTLPTPWTPTNVQYRANVLSFLRQLAVRGARPFLLVPSDPSTAGEAASWWQQAAQVADVVREVYFRAPVISAMGPLLGSRAFRQRMRTAVSSLTGIAVPPTRVGLMLGFQSGGIYGRAGLQPRAAWLQFVKLNALAARQVARELGVGTIWSWGWGTFGPAGADADKPTAACVYLWTRDSSLCNAPAAAGPDFNASLTEGQIVLPAGAHCSVAGGVIASSSLERAARLTGDRAAAFTALFARAVQRARLRVPATAVLQAERGIVRRHFAGSRRRYLRALERRRVTLSFARGVIADELRRRGIADAPAWTVAEQTKALETAICLRDELPASGDERLADRIVFLRLP